MTKPSLRNATIEDYETFYGHKPKVTIRAVVAELDGKVVGIGGIAYYKNQMVAFSEIRDDLRKYPVFIMKAAKRIAKLLDKHGKSAVAIACPKEGNSQAMLERVGFTKISSTEEQETYQWLSRQQ